MSIQNHLKLMGYCHAFSLSYPMIKHLSNILHEMGIIIAGNMHRLNLMNEQPVKLDHKRAEWQQQLAEAFNNAEKLCNYLNISIQDLPISTDAAKNFPLRVPQSFANCMEKGNPGDPLLRQVLPVYDETVAYPGFSSDPVGDLDSVSEPGILNKYQSRVLLISTGSCAINCRYCFRRNFPYSENQLSKQKEDKAIQYVVDQPDIREVILSGGDPLLLNDSRLAFLLHKLDRIPHVKRIRIHSRIPIVLPSRITNGFIDLLNQQSKQLILVVHCNHSNEISEEVEAACFTLQQNNIYLLNQAVLLKGVNDSADQLCRLSEKLFATGILPYYLHMLDKATGTGHFEVSETDAVRIMQQVREQLPGYLVPKLVREQAGALFKLPVEI